MNDKVLSIIIKAQDQASKVLANVASTAEGTSTRLASSFITAGKYIAVAGAAAGTAMIGLGIKSAASYEQSRVAFETMLGSADKARQMMQSLSDFAKSTPFELPEVVAASKQLLAFGVAQEQIIPTMRRLGDIAAGVGVPVGQLSYVYGQVRLSGKLMAQDLMQFTNAGVPLLDYLSQTMHKTTQQIKSDMDKGAGPSFAQVQTAIEAMTNSGGKFGGMMDKQSHTFSGVVSNIKDGFGQMLRAAVGITPAGDILKGSLFDRLKDIADIAMPALQKAAANTGPVMRLIMDTITGGDPTLKKGEERFIGLVKALNLMRATIGPVIAALIKIIGFVNEHRIVLASAAGAIIALLIPAFIAWAAAAYTAAVATIAATWPILLIGAAVGAVAYLIITHWSNIKNAFQAGVNFIKEIWQGIEEVARVIWQAVVIYVTTYISIIVAIITGVYNVVKTVFTAIYTNAIAPVINFMTTAFQIWLTVVTYVFDVFRGLALVAWWFIYNNAVSPVINAISTAINWLGGVISAVWNAIRDAAVTVWNAISSAASTAWNWIYSNVISPVANAIKAAASAVGNTVNSVWNSIHNTASSVWNSISGFVSSVWGKLTGGAQSAGSSIKGVFSGVGDSIKSAFSTAVNWVIDKLNSLINAVNGTVGRLPGVPKIANIPHFANGTDYAPGGLALVGERGPELVNLPRGSQVFTNQQSQQMASGSTFNMYGNIQLGDQSAVDRFFERLDQQKEMAALGVGV